MILIQILIILKIDPLKIFGIEIDKFVLRRFRRISSLLGLNIGDFVTTSGYVLYDQQEEDAARIFDHVRNGEVILPSPDEPFGTKIKVESGLSESEDSDRFRHWGQQYLSGLNPSSIDDGELLGSGGSYKAYDFGDKTVVEFDQEGRATYLFNSVYFKKLRFNNRQNIIDDEPEGFKGRIFHYDVSRINWQNQVNEFLGIQI